MSKKYLCFSVYICNDSWILLIYYYSSKYHLYNLRGNPNCHSTAPWTRCNTGLLTNKQHINKECRRSALHRPTSATFGAPGHQCKEVSQWVAQGWGEDGKGGAFWRGEGWDGVDTAWEGWDWQWPPLSPNPLPRIFW